MVLKHQIPSKYLDLPSVTALHAFESCIYIYIYFLSYDNLFSSSSPQVLRILSPFQKRRRRKKLHYKIKEQGIRKKVSVACEVPSLIFKLICNCTVHTLHRTVNWDVNTLRRVVMYHRCSSFVGGSELDSMTDLMILRGYSLSRCKSMFVCVHLCACCMYLSLSPSLPGSDMCMQTQCLEGDMTKNSQKPLSCSFFFFPLPFFLCCTTGES